jgi:hypothetical protein
MNAAWDGESAKQARLDAKAEQFRTALGRVRVGNRTTGKGGMTVREVVALLGRPSDTQLTTIGSAPDLTGGHLATSYYYFFFQATGSPRWRLDFTKGRVSYKGPYDPYDK